MAVIISWIKTYSSANDGEILNGQDLGDIQTAIDNHDHTFISGTFLGLTDTPGTYVGQSLKGVRVNAGETALEFYTTGGGGGSAASYSRTFTNADLTNDYRLGVAHLLGIKLVVCQVFDNNYEMIIPDSILLNDTNSLTLDLSSFVTAGGGSITGTWSVKVVA